jgi:hypothetical protein
MMLDQQLMFADAQVVTATGNSTNVIDTANVGTGTATPARNLGAGEPIHVYAKVGTVSGTGPTLTIALTAADDSAFATNKITVTSVTPTLTVGQADAFVRMGIPVHAPRRFYRLEYTVGGTTPSVTISSGIAFDEQVTSMT